MNLRHLSPPFCAVLGSLLLLSSVPVAGQELDQSQVEALKKKLETLTKQLKTGKKGNNSRLSSIFKKAAASDQAAAQLYLECVRAQRFERNESSAADFGNWKENTSVFLKTKPVRLLLRAQLLFLTAAASAGATYGSDDFEKAIPDIENFLDFYLQAEPVFAHPEEEFGRGRKYNNRDITDRWNRFKEETPLDSVFARKFGMDATAPPPEDWPESLADTATIYDGFLLPYLRKKKDTASIDRLWAGRIAKHRGRAKTRLEQKHIAESKDIIEKTIPPFLWGRAKDKFLYGDKSAGSGEMVSVIEKNLSHPEASSWLGQLSSLLDSGTGEIEEEPDGTGQEEDDDGTGEKSIGDLLRGN